MLKQFDLTGKVAIVTGSSTGLGAAIFGAYWGFVYVWFGAMAGAAAAFLATGRRGTTLVFRAFVKQVIKIGRVVCMAGSRPHKQQSHHCCTENRASSHEFTS